MGSTLPMNVSPKTIMVFAFLFWLRFSEPVSGIEKTPSAPVQPSVRMKRASHSGAGLTIIDNESSMVISGDFSCAVVVFVCMQMSVMRRAGMMREMAAVLLFMVNHREVRWLFTFSGSWL